MSEIEVTTFYMCSYAGNTVLPDVSEYVSLNFDEGRFTHAHYQIFL